jgi:two-component system, OmpR family, response regulator
MNESVKRVLVVDGDSQISEVLRVHLQADGFAVEQAGDCRQGLVLVERRRWDAIVLDLMLPGIDGLEICRRARELARYTPIIMTSARGSEAHRIRGLELGADDYLAKPFSVPELLARLKALLRRVDVIAQGMRWDHRMIQTGGLVIDRLARQAWLNGRRLAFAPREFELLQFFAQNPERIYSCIELLNRVWGSRHEGFEHTVKTHINRLRSKIETDPRNPARIVTVWGSGYKFCLPVGAADVPR